MQRVIDKRKNSNRCEYKKLKFQITFLKATLKGQWSQISLVYFIYNFKSHAATHMKFSENKTTGMDSKEFTGQDCR